LLGSKINKERHMLKHGEPSLLAQGLLGSSDDSTADTSTPTPAAPFLTQAKLLLLLLLLRRR
jgi:hypothetical protein